MNVSRRSFFGTLAAGTGGLAVGAEKVFDGGMAAVTEPGVPRRTNRDGSPAPLVPPGAGSWRNFRARCVGCQLCVAACPNKVLRPSGGRLAPTPEMGFEKGWCRSECTRCGEVCPTGAIRRLTREEKRDVHVGHAIWHKDACLAAQKGERCTLCVRHCPAKAIVQVKLRPDDPKSPLVPAIDKRKCIGCGACEHFCPARPMPGITVKGFAEHREVRPMTQAEAVAEARRCLASAPTGDARDAAARRQARAFLGLSG